MPRKKKDRGQKIVRNMGLYWKRDKVRWKGNSGIGPARLAGTRLSAKTKGDADFWNQTGIYALYADYHLIYVGQAGLSDKSCLGNRLKQHLTDDLAGRWNAFSWFGLQIVRGSDNKVGRRAGVSVSSRGHLANVLEGIIIEVAEPPMNSQGARFGRGVERYIQVDDSIDSNAATETRIRKDISKLDEKVDRMKGQVIRAIRTVRR